MEPECHPSRFTAPSACLAADVPVMLYDFETMTCPGCASQMQHLALDGKLGTTVAVDLCVSCRVIWFDHLKELQLAPRGTLSLFGIISTPTAAPETPLP